MTLAEWRAAVDGYAETATDRRREQAWVLSYQLIAAGCEPDKVTPAKLLGEKVKRTPIFDPDVQRQKEKEKIMAKLRRQAQKRGANGLMA